MVLSKTQNGDGKISCLVNLGESISSKVTLGSSTS